MVRQPLTPYKMLVLLQHAQLPGFARVVHEDGTVVVDVHWPSFRRLLCISAGRQLKYLGWLLDRKYVILVQRRRGYMTLALPPPVAWPASQATPGPVVGESPSEDPK